MNCATAGTASRKAFSPRIRTSIPVRSASAQPVHSRTARAAAPHDSGLPIILVSHTPSGASSFFAQPGATSGDPRQRVDTNNQFIESFSWKIDKHDLKLGFEFHRTSIEQILRQVFPRATEIQRTRVTFLRMASRNVADSAAFNTRANSRAPHLSKTASGSTFRTASV